MRIVWLLLIGLSAVGCKNDEVKVTPAAACDAYLTCVSAVAPQTFGAALTSYGPDSQCWKAPSTAAACETSCRESMKALAAANPGKTACAASAADGGGPRPDGLPPRPDIGPLPPAAELDLLFLVDNSNSMGEEQAMLTKSIRTLLDSLRSPKLGGPGCSPQNRQACRLPSLRLGVVSSDLGAGNYSLPSCESAGGDGGKLQSKARIAGCQPPKDPWISYNDGVTNLPSPGADPLDDVAKAFSCIGSLGLGGCGFEHQLEALRRALDPSLNVNPGFLRPDAYLAIVILTDEDDCSAQKTVLFDPAQQGLTDPLGPLTSFRCFEFGMVCDEKNLRDTGVKHGCVPGQDYLYRVEDYVKFFQGLKPPGRLFLMAVAGPTDSPPEVGRDGQVPALKASCQGANGFAAPALRVAAVVKALGPERGFFNQGLSPTGASVTTSICSTDYTPAQRLLGEKIAAAGAP